MHGGDRSVSLIFTNGLLTENSEEVSGLAQPSGMSTGPGLCFSELDMQNMKNEQ